MNSMKDGLNYITADKVTEAFNNFTNALSQKERTKYFRLYAIHVFQKYILEHFCDAFEDGMYNIIDTNYIPENNDSDILTVYINKQDISYNEKIKFLYDEIINIKMYKPLLYSDINIIKSESNINTLITFNITFMNTPEN